MNWDFNDLDHALVTGSSSIDEPGYVGRSIHIVLYEVNIGVKIDYKLLGLFFSGRLLLVNVYICPYFPQPLASVCFLGPALALKRQFARKPAGNKLHYLLDTACQELINLQDRDRATAAATFLSQKLQWMSNQKMVLALPAMLMAFQGGVQAKISLRRWISLMLPQVIGPFLQAQTRLLSQLRAPETLSVL